MRFQSILFALSLACSTFVAAQHDFDGNHVYARRAEAALRARDAVAEVHYYNELIARDAEPDFSDLWERDAEPDLVAHEDHLHYVRSPGQSSSKVSGGGSRVSSNPPKHPMLKKCNLCGGMCTSTQRTCTSAVHHRGATGICLEIPGQS
ncbi:hypothetical protein MMC18_008686 [Xylographa bjoerkii]|nr:hypothetical protein [Xylographa bjoerkii]